MNLDSRAKRIDARYVGERRKTPSGGSTCTSHSDIVVIVAS